MIGQACCMLAWSLGPERRPLRSLFYLNATEATLGFVPANRSFTTPWSICMRCRAISGSPVIAEISPPEQNAPPAPEMMIALA